MNFKIASTRRMGKGVCVECENEVDYRVLCYHNAVRSFNNGEKITLENYYVCECKECGDVVIEQEYRDKNIKQVESKLGVCFVTMADAMFNGEKDILERKSAEVIKECK